MLKGKFSFVVKEDEVSIKIYKEVKDFLIYHNLKECNNKPDYIIVIGGDGTVLSAFRKYLDIVNDVKFITIHTGHLGFYTDYQVKNYKNIFEDILNRAPQVESYPLLAVEAYCTQGNMLTKNYALNEITFNNSMGSTYVAEVYINDEHFENFRGDGICISTPTGSTAYNKSLGGAVIHPKMDIFQVTEIAALNNLVYRTLGNPVILSKDEVLTIKPKNQVNNNRLSIDQSYYSNESLSKIKITLSKTKKISFLRYNNVSFWKRVKRSFIGE
ncbi:NAD kinase [Gemella sp. GH3]|uniref:NAD kinase n=1 Tax=unclassified Gemella TaxID=2624949 RepID=UPI0015D01C70|nr:MULTISPECIES: NAD kinase [unclassified Gemella]MBF0713726.1 NAD kinase [Gemella sp. GH3.1]NYS50678.1 NAD kinase [Gemella sp. GH3]